MKQHLLHSLPLPALALLCACNGGLEPESHNLGDTSSEVVVSDPGPATALQDFAGTWIGEAQDLLGPRSNGAPATYHFPSGTTHIRFEYSNRQVPSLSFGSSEAPPPPTDLDASYPPGFDYEANALWFSSLLPPTEGYPYHAFFQNPSGTAYPVPNRVGNSAVVDGSVHLSFNVLESLNAWCVAQTPQQVGDAGYGCLGGNGFGGGGGHCTVAPADAPVITLEDGTQTQFADVPVDCGKLYLCEAAPQPPCQCSIAGCNINTELVSDLFLSRDGDELVGVFSNSVFLRDQKPIPLGEVRFKRAE